MNSAEQYRHFHLLPKHHLFIYSLVARFICIRINFSLSHTQGIRKSSAITFKLTVMFVVFSAFQFVQFSVLRMLMPNDHLDNSAGGIALFSAIFFLRPVSTARYSDAAIHNWPNHYLRLQVCCIIIIYLFSKPKFTKTIRQVN